MSTPAMGVVTQVEKKKPVTVSAHKSKKAVKAAKLGKAKAGKPKMEKSKRVTLNFDDHKKPVKAKKVVKNKNYRSIYCQDGYVVNNHAYCMISAKAKPAKVVAKKTPVKAVKAQRDVASQKDLTTKRR